MIRRFAKPLLGSATPTLTTIAGAGCGHVGEQALTAKQLRMLCCDADIIPAVLGSESEILDVGRTNRLVTKPIRHALTLRDSGCTFPGCETPPASYDPERRPRRHNRITTRQTQAPPGIAA
jgi:hypothetical protein